MDTFDVVVIGGGPAGENAAGRCATGGLRVALVEDQLVGGECSYWACMPSKTLLRPGEVLAAARRVPGAREAAAGALDVGGALARRDWVTAGWDDAGQARWLDDNGVELMRGHGRLAGERAVEVVDHDGARHLLHARRAVVLATGSRPGIPPIPGLREVRHWESRDVTSAEEVPPRLVVLGGGVVGVEMAQAWRRLGSESVTIIEGGDRLLSREEPFVSEELRAAFEKEGIRVLTGVHASRVARDSTDGPVRVALDDGEEIVGDELLVATGRRPATDDLGLEHVDLEPGHAVEVDDQLRAVGVRGGWLYAIGDVNGRALLTHMGKYQGRLAADHILGHPVDAAVGHRAVPRVVFTDPQVASVGLTEHDARARKMRIRTVRYAMGEVAAASTRGEGIGGSALLVVDDDRRVVVGATFTGPDIGELLHSATIAVVGEVALERLWHAVPSFPTLSEVWLKLLEAYGL